MHHLRRQSHPVKQGLVQAFSVYIDTLFVCSATGFMLLITGLYNVQGVDGAALYTGLLAAGPGYVQTAMESMMPALVITLLPLRCSSLPSRRLLPTTILPKLISPSLTVKFTVHG
jgi:Na+/alanine symporter